MRVPVFNGQLAVKIHKHLLDPEEKALMVASMKARVGKGQYNAFVWARIFHRLPATVMKIATEAGVNIQP